MITFENEEILLTSDDKVITLTNQRVIYKTSEVNQEILLKDVVGNEIVHVREKFFLYLGIIIVASFFVLSNEGLETEKATSHFRMILLIIAVVFFYCYYSITKKNLKITGRYNTIEFSIKNLSQDSLNTFLNRLSIESENRKKEKE
jgi:hypothetical protein